MSENETTEPMNPPAPWTLPQPAAPKPAPKPKPKPAAK